MDEGGGRLSETVVVGPPIAQPGGQVVGLVEREAVAPKGAEREDAPRDQKTGGKESAATQAGQSPRQTPSSRAVSTVSQSRGTTFIRFVACARGT